MHAYEKHEHEKFVRCLLSGVKAVVQIVLLRRSVCICLRIALPLQRATKKQEYTFGAFEEGSDTYDLICTRVAQRRWFYAENFNCPAKDTEKKKQRCLTNQAKRRDDLMAICKNQ